MSTNIVSVWDSSWTSTSINSNTVSNTGSIATGTIDNSGHSATEVAVSVTYPSSGTTAGIDVYVLRDVNGTYEAVGDSPFGFVMDFAVSTTFNRTFTVMSDRVSKFKIEILNNSGASATVTVSYKQAVIQGS